MPRIRTVKPEFWQDEKLAVLDPLTRLVFLGLISMADDAGRLVDNVKSIDGFIFPETEDTCKKSLETLARTSRISRYVSSSGQRLIQIANWGRHQLVAHPSKYVLPAPTAEDLTRQPVIESSREPHENLTSVSGNTRDSTNDLRPTTNDLVAANAANGVTPATKKRPSGDPPAVLTWVQEAVEIHDTHIGQLSHGKAGKTLKDLVHKRGWPEVKPVFEHFCQFAPYADYLTRMEGGTLRFGEEKVKKFGYTTSLQSFVEHYTHWAEQATT